MQITSKNKIYLHLNQSYINVWNRNHTSSRFRIPLITIPIQFQTILTKIPPLTLTKNNSESNSHWSQSQNRSLIPTPEYESPQVWIIFLS